MLFAWIGFLKSSDPIDPAIQQQISDFLQQPYIPFRSAGPLCDGSGNRAGYLAIFEAADRSTAEALVHSSPIRAAGLYSEFHLFEYYNEAG